MVIMRKSVLIIFGILFCQFLMAQVMFPAAPQNDLENTLESEAESVEILEQLEVIQDPRLEKMLKWDIENNRKRDGIVGFRVEIFFSSSLNAMERAKNIKKEFLSKYPDYDVHIKFIAPNFRVRVGDFRTKNEALKLYKKIQKNYDGAFIVPDLIDFPMLKTEKYE